MRAFPIIRAARPAGILGSALRRLPRKGPMAPANERYSRQTAFAPIGERGLEALQSSRILIVGCGGIGSHSANLLARAGAGFLRIADRDVVEVHNLHRQVLFGENDVAAPKAIAAAERLRAASAGVTVEPVVADVHHRNIPFLVDGIDIILDGTDNFATRFLINDAALARRIPWIYTGVIGGTGHTLAILPERGPCLRCLLPRPPPPGAVETCETAGVWGGAVAAASSIQVTAALKVLLGEGEELRGTLYQLEVWRMRFRTTSLQPDPGCPACARREFPFLDEEAGPAVQVICGREAVEILPEVEGAVDLVAAAKRLCEHGEVLETPYLLRWRGEGVEAYLFPDGRAIFKGVGDPELARSLYERYVGGCDADLS